MRKLIACWGLPGSGKSTWAKEVVLKNKDAVRLNRDEMRTMYHGRPWGDPQKEFRITETRDVLIEHFMREGVLIIVDETNLHPRSLPSLERLVGNWNKLHDEDEQYAFEVKRFDISIEKAIERDLQRPVSVGEAVIRRMYRNYIQPKETIKYRDDLPEAIIVDMDGTLAHMVGRGPYEFDRVDEDRLDEMVKEIVVANHNAGRTILVASGRDDSCRDKTIEWLERHKVPYDQLLMRVTGDKRKDSIVKREIFDASIRGKYNVMFVIDDRKQVVDMWRQTGLVCWQVAEGDF